MKPVLSPEAETLLDLYHSACLCDSYDRAKVSKLITAYNRKNPTEKLKTYHIIQRNFPTLFQHLLNFYKTDEDSLLENKFTKIFFNLNILPSAQTSSGYRGIVHTRYMALAPYSGIRNSFFSDAYDGKNLIFKNIINGRLFVFRGSTFVSQDHEAFTISINNLNALAMFVEV